MKTIKLEEFNIIGISARTTNANNNSLKDIGELFGQFMSQNMMERIPGRLSNDILCVYTEYESDFNGPYTVIIGCKVGSLKEIPAGLIGKTIPASTYQLYKSTGKLSESMMKTWENIWKSDIDRKYSADFDIYGEKSKDFENGEVDTYVAIN